MRSSDTKTCLGFWRENTEEINTPYYSSSSWCSWAQPQGSLGSPWRPQQAPLGAGPVWPGFLRWNKRTRPVCPLLTSPWVWATPRRGLPWVGGSLWWRQLRVVHQQLPASGTASPSPSGIRSQFSLQLSCTVLSFFFRNFIFLSNSS